ncbi:MAG: DUF445 domain-containing protein [Candidatus Acetothermia bacterium]|jgi:uncharacterized membrane protein YheB (UPF0754 family)|nr:DUF445 domain-containing protein [Candidatus Acetothermia bacterium]MDH7504875.1 DUF445 family protein [Candidatus Acetothermia bacterium]
MLEGRSVYALISIPLASALVGYLTNWVAIRMLFRPHCEKRLFGVRVPFTPGLIPRKRAALAESIGLAVSEHLLTGEALAAQFAARQVTAKLGEIVHDHFQRLLARQLGSLASLIPDQLKEEWDHLLASLRERLDRWLSSVLEGPELGQLLEERVAASLDEALARPLGEFLSEELLDSLAVRLGELLTEVAGEEDFARQVRDFLREEIEALLQQERPLGSLIPEPLRQAAYAGLEESLPGVLDRLIGVLEDERVQKRIKLQLYELVDRLLSEQFQEESLWDQMKLGLFETFVISAEDLKGRIDQGVAELAPRVAELVRNPQVQRRIYQSLRASLDGLLEWRLSDLRIDPEILGQIEAGLTGAVVGLVRSPKLQGRLVEAVRMGLAKLRSRPVRELLRGPDREDSRVLGRLLTEQVLQLLRARPTQEALAQFLYDRLLALLQRPIGRLADYLPREALAKLEQATTEQLGKVLRDEAPRIIAALDIRSVVRERVAEFSTAEVERLIVGVAGEQLRAITWFGAVLGFAIGLVQVAIILLGR